MAGSLRVPPSPPAAASRTRRTASATAAEQLQYQFDHLLPGRFYKLDLSFLLCGSGSISRVQRVLVDGMEIARDLTVSKTTTSYHSFLLDPSF